jgi:hypothetical protein
MLDEVRHLLSAKGVNHLLGRLNDTKSPKQLIGAEMELGLLWAMSKTARLEIEPALPNSTRVPEAFSPDFFDQPSYIEVTTISDGSLSGEERMQRAAQKIVDYANTCRKRSANNLNFSFEEKSHWEGRSYYREHDVAADFELDDAMKAQICAWVKSSDFATTTLRLQGEKINVTVAGKEYRQKPGFNFFSPLPPLAYPIKDNPLYAALDEKADQLAGAPDTSLKVVFVADGGSQLLRRLTDRDPLRQYKSGGEIISHFLGKHEAIDMVCVFSPQRKFSVGLPVQPVLWKVTAFDGVRRRIRSHASLEKLCQLLPRPRLEGYQARSIQRQSGFVPERGWYLGSEIGSGKEKITMKLSARLLQEFLAGRITAERFDDNSTGKNLFEVWLKMGFVMSDARFESAGVDEDDDYVILEFRRDPAAAPFG